MIDPNFGEGIFSITRYPAEILCWKFSLLFVENRSQDGEVLELPLYLFLPFSSNEKKKYGFGKYIRAVSITACPLQGQLITNSSIQMLNWRLNYQRLGAGRAQAKYSSPLSFPLLQQWGHTDSPCYRWANGGSKKFTVSSVTLKHLNDCFRKLE